MHVDLLSLTPECVSKPSWALGPLGKDRLCPRRTGRQDHVASGLSLLHQENGILVKKTPFLLEREVTLLQAAESRVSCWASAACGNDSSLGGRGEPEAGPAVPMGSRERECGEATGLVRGHQTRRRNRCPKPRPQSKSVALFGCFPTALRPWLPRTNQKIKTTRAPGAPIFAVNFLSFLRVETVSGILTVSVTRGAHTGFTASLGEEGI